MAIICDKCGSKYNDVDADGQIQQNLFGKICKECGNFILPEKKLPIVEENKNKFKILQIKALKSVYNRFKKLMGENNGNSKR